MPLAVAAAQMAAARTVLPTSVSVPVTKTPRMRGRGYSGCFSETVVDAAAHDRLVDDVERRADGLGWCLRQLAHDRAHRTREHARGLLKLGPGVRRHHRQP